MNARFPAGIQLSGWNDASETCPLTVNQPYVDLLDGQLYSFLTYWLWIWMLRAVMNPPLL